MHRCGKCSATWTGTTIAHCGVCHRTFSAPSTFGRHRSGFVFARVCLDPASVGLAPNAYGVFRTPSKED